MQLHANDGRAYDPGGCPFACESGCARPRERRAVGARRGCFTKVTDRKLFVIERQEHRSASRQINRADPAEALRSSPDASVSSGSPSCCGFAPMPLVCETASVQTSSAVEPRRCGCSPRGAEAAERRLRGRPSTAGLHQKQRPRGRGARGCVTPWSGSPGVDAVVTVLCLRLPDVQFRVRRGDRTDPSATRTVRACGEERGRDPCGWFSAPFGAARASLTGSRR